MKLKVDNEEVFELSETKKKVLKNDVHADEFEADMKRRVRWVIEHKYEQCYKRLKEEWTPKLASAGVQSVPLDPDAFAELVFQQPAYQDRKTRSVAEEAARLAQRV